MKNNPYVMVPALPEDKQLLKIVATHRGRKLWQLMHEIAVEVAREDEQWASIRAKLPAPADFDAEVDARR